MPRLNDKLQKMSERSFLIFQIVLALLLAAIGSFCILFVGNDSDSESLNTLGLAAAVIVCAGIPSLLRKWIDRPMEKLNQILVAAVVIIGIACAIDTFL